MPSSAGTAAVRAALLSDPAVADALVGALSADGGRHPTAYLLPRSGRSVDLGAVHRAVTATVVPAQVPREYVVVSQLPRAGMEDLGPTALTSSAEWMLDAFAPPLTRTEERLAELWGEVLDVPYVGRTDDFFDLGGHSILIPLVIAGVHDLFGVELPMLAGFEHSRLLDLAQLVDTVTASR